VLNSVTPGLVNLIRVVDSSGSSKYPFSANTYSLDAQHSLDAPWGHHLTYGANYRHNALASTAIDAFSREDRFGLFVQDAWKSSETLTITAGARLDLHTEINTTVSPRVAILYTPLPNHTFRAGFSIAYRPPTLFESHEQLRASTTLPPPIPVSTMNVNGSAALNPEQILSYEMGYQGWYFKHRLRARADLFFNHLSNLVGNRNTSSTTATFVNDSGHADIYGGEAGLEFLAASWLTGFGNMSYQEINQSLTGTVRRGAPRFKWNAGLRGEWDRGLSGEIGYHYVGSATYPIASTFTSLAPFGVTTPPERVGSYSLLNLRAGYKFWQQKAAAGYLRDAEVAVSAFNALNDKHKEHPLGDTIGSRVMGWLTVRF
jgi:iron complex outermembrane receptor protein